MKLTHDGRFERDDIWSEGKWLDLWSVVHSLTGISFGLGIIIFQFGTIASVVIVFLLLVTYEMWEAMVKIEETPQNRMMDVIVGMATFTPTFFFISPVLFKTNYVLVFGLVLTTNIVMATFGWLASQKADVFEARLRREVLQQRAKFLARRERRHTEKIHRHTNHIVP